MKILMKSIDHEEFDRVQILKILMKSTDLKDLELEYRS